ncbi:MAG: putative mucin/carbohydrate-binding domain-containing protein [Clostridium sp.]
MKKKKLALIVAITVAGNYFVPISGALTAHADVMNVKKGIESKSNGGNKTTLEKNNITFYNIWGGKTASVDFNTETMKIEANRMSGNLGNNNNTYLHLFLFNSKENKVEINQNVEDGSSSNLTSLLNGKSFNYGDIIGIDFEENANTPNINNIGNIQKNEMTYYKITKDGLVKYTPNISVKPFAVLTGNKVTEGTIEGAGAPNSEVVAEINGQAFTGSTNSNGEFTVKVNDSNGFTQNTKILLAIPSAIGVINKTIKPSISNEVKIQNSNIQIINAWGSNAGEIGFNPLTKTFKISGYNNYLGQSGNNFLNVELYSLKNQKEVLNDNFKGNSSTSAVYNSLNNKPFNYGDIIKISFDKGQGNINVSNNETDLAINSDGTSYYEITEGGLVPFKENLSVNPLNILNGQNETTATLTGKTNKNAEVSAIINGKTFKAKANNNGEFNLGITSSNGFFPSTTITVSAEGALPISITPTAPNNLGIENENINLPNGSLGTSENISFDASTMKIKSYGNTFLAELINPNNGQVKASAINNNFKVFNSQNNLNGASFNYGDIITMYEPQETYLSDGNIDLITNGNKNYIDSNEKFVSYKIEPQGLVPLGNKNLSNVKAEYIGNSNIAITGKTNPDTDVTISYGSSLSNKQTVKSNGVGDFTLQLPIADAELNTQVQVYLNNENMQSTLVSYDSKKYGTNDSVQIINNDNFPVIGMTFDLINNKINTTVDQYDKTYAGTFYGNKMNISLLSKDGKVIKSVTSKSPAQIQEFASSLNGLGFTEGDILKIQYNKNFGSVDVLKNKKEIGNSNGNAEYFEITNKGLVNITNKFVSANPLEILNGNKVTEGTLTGQAGKNEIVTVNVNGQDFTGKTDGKGNYSINIKDTNGFTADTNIEISANGYLPCTINPSYGANVGLQNSSINLYTNGYTIEMSNLASKIGFDLNNKTITVTNYEKTLGNGNDSLFNLGLYNTKGEKIFEKSFNNGSTSNISEALNGKEFNYGDILELSYNPSVNKPVVLNGNNVIGNITGQKEYFKITPQGLVRVNMNNNVVKDNTKDTYVKLTNKNEISSYANTLNENIQKLSNTNLNENAKAQNSILASRFISTIGESNLEAFYSSSAENANFLNWVLNNNTAMSEFLGGPNPGGAYVPEGQPSASYIDCLKVWSNIWNTYENSHAGFNLKLAIAVALTNGQPIMSFPAGVPVGSPVQRYNIFETLNAEGGMLPEFETLGVNQLCFITNTDIKNDQIIDMRNVMLQNHNGLILENGTLHYGAFTINYNTRNPHTGASVFGNNFYGPNPNVYSIWYDGGVCGATGRMGADVDKIFGVPATQTPQPGHNAFIYYQASNKTWQQGNNIEGWAQTYDADMSSWSNQIAPNSEVASYNVLYQEADNSTLAESNNYKYLASIQNSYDAKLNDLKEAIKVNKLNLGAWIDLVNLEKNNKDITMPEYNELVQNIISTFNDYPMPMYDLLLQLKNTYMTRGTQEDFNNYVQTITNELNKEANANLSQYQSPVASYLLTQMSSNGLSIGNTLLGNSNIQIVNGWGTDAGLITFNPGTMKINVAQYNAYLGASSNHTFLNIEVYNKDGKVLYKGELKGDNNTSALSSLLNGKTFNYGDIIAISHDTSQGKVTINNNGKVLSNNDNGTSYFEITRNGLVVQNSKPEIVKPNTPNESKPVIKPETKPAVKPVVKNETEIAKEGLVQAINECKTKLNSKEYNKASNAELQKMINNAQSVLENKNSGETQYKEMTTLLNNVLNEIVKKEVIKVNKTGLENAISNGEKIVKENIYTEKSMDTLKNALLQGNKVVENNEANTEDVTNATDNINNDIKGLVKKQSETEIAKEGLIQAINECKAKLNSKEYNKESNAELQKMINNAQSVLENKNSGEAQYKEMTQLLNMISNEVVKAEVVKKDTNNDVYIKNFTNTLNKVENILKTPNSNEIYTQSSIKLLQERIALANDVIAKKYPKEETIDATNLMNNALEVIQKRDGIEGLINEINAGQSKLNSGDNYTQESQNALKQAITNGENVLRNTAENGTQIINAINNIKEKINSLTIQQSTSIWSNIWNYINSIF